MKGAAMFHGRYPRTVLRCAVALAILAACRADEPQPPSLPDIVLITLDTTRADHIGHYGYPRDTSPALDALAAGAIVFERNIVPMATTLPTHTSLLTGTWPEEHGVMANIDHGGRQFVPSEQLQTFTSWLHGIGYQTAGFVSAAPLKAGTGVDIGFDLFSAPEKSERRAGPTTDAVLEWMPGADSSKPVFLWVHYYDPHNPYRAPPAYRDRFSSDSSIDQWLAERQVSPVAHRPTGERVVARRAIDQYDAEIRYMDDQIARLLDALKARGRWDHTAVMVSGDHGEGLCQHIEPGHGLLWGEQLHAPMMLRVPGAAAQRVATTVSVVDLVPTLLGRINLPDEATFLSQVSGRDTLSDSTPRASWSRMSKRQEEFFGKPAAWALTTDRWKFVHSADGSHLLFDLTSDPFELVEVQDQHPDIVHSLRTTLLDGLAAQRQRAQELGSGQTRSVDAETLEQLRALGYLGEE